jgi:capsular exopolysaccharide synthesis family protein
VAAEQYRVTATRLVLMSAHRKSTVVLVTSAVKGEGKTSSALNLAYVLAHDLGKSTFIIDCDFKHPRLSRYAGLAEGPGLAEVLGENVPVDSCVQSLNGDPFSVLTGGSVSKHPVQLRQIEKLKALLETFRDRHDFIVLDTPPIYPLADVNVLANMADVVVLVIRAGTTPRDLAKRALSALKAKHEKTALLTGVLSQDAPHYLQEGYYIQPEAKAH